MKGFACLMAICLIGGILAMPVSAYTEEEKELAKSMLQAYGYSPDWEGANQAYQDYLSGKYNDICEQYGLPKQNVQEEPQTEVPQEPQTEVPQTEEKQQRKTEQEEYMETQAVEEDTESGVLEEDKVHFGEIKKVDGFGRAELLDILISRELSTPVASDKSGKINASKGMIFADLVFEVVNEGEETISAEEFLRISINDGSNDYAAGKIMIENSDGTAFLDETVLNPGEKAVLHYAIEVPEESKEFEGKIEMGDFTSVVIFDRNTHPSNRKQLYEGKAIQRSGFGMLTLQKIQVRENSAGMAVVEIPVTLKNLKSDQVQPDQMGGILAATESGICRGSLKIETEQEVVSEDNMEGMFEIQIPDKQWEQGVELFIFFGGNWYEIAEKNS